MREDWTECKAEEFGELIRGITYNKNQASDIPKDNYLPILRANNINNNRLNFNDIKYVDSRLIGDIQKIIPNDIVIAMSSGSKHLVGKSAQTKVHYDGSFGAFCSVYRPNENVDGGYVSYFFQSNDFRKNISEISKGSNINNLKREHILNFVFPLAPLPIQRAIVSKIEALFSDLDNGIANFKKAQEQLKMYRQAVLKKAFEGELTKEWREKRALSGVEVPTAEELLKQIKEERQNHYNQQIEDWKKAVKEWEKNGKKGKKPTIPKKWNEIEPLTDEELKTLFELQEGISWRKIGETCAVKGGKRLPKGQDFSKEKTPYNYIMAGNLKNGTVINEVNYINKVTYDELYHYRVNKDDAYITIVGACIGDAGVIPESHHLSILTENAAKIICTSSLSSKYISYWLNSLVAQIRIKQSVFSMTLGKLALSRIEEIEFPLCSLQEQTQIIQEIESRLSVCDKMEQSIKESIEKAEALRQSILKKAFEGKLLSQAEIEQCKQAADYEPANELLKKIKAEKLAIEQALRQAQGDKKKKSTTKKKDVAKSKIPTDIQAGVISKVIQLHENNPEYLDKLTHVKCEKISHLVEYHLQIPLGRIPVKDAAGPDDYNHLKKVEHRAKMAAYFTVVKQKIGHTYLSNRNITAAIAKLESILTTIQKDQLDRLIGLFLKFDLESAEIIATLYAGWNNLLIDGKSPTDDEIVFESRENWSQRKLTIRKERFYKALQWMRKDEIALIPTGYGNKVLKPKNKR